MVKAMKNWTLHVHMDFYYLFITDWECFLIYIFLKKKFKLLDKYFIVLIQLTAATCLEKWKVSWKMHLFHFHL